MEEKEGGNGGGVRGQIHDRTTRVDVPNSERETS